ncbi:transcription termination factor Rho [Roseburia sp. AM59-24XD]|jgi:transcription termination factor Rho|uniref:transcription termination factor Rho n=1 Tax=Roseburia sp. AM59-24XD TaxID=2293138 RepID=UPI000E52A228|nr:transcription termination factor Rho [Roseburia sp. AM59-24XD]RHP87850.1 transcription termination factor Rho [Roseburia sp. AM59-24XD]
MEELEKMSLVELRLYGRKLGMKNATTFKKKELIGEIQKILASGEAPEAEKTAKSSAKGSREKKSDTTEGKRTAKTTAKPAGRRTERRPARKNDYEDRGAAGSRAPRPVVRGGYTSNLQEMHTVREDRRYGSGRDNRYNRDERSNGREDRYSRDERNNGREDRYSRDERNNGREERYSRDERNNGREDRYSRDENGNNQENYSTHDRNAAHDDSQHTGHVNMRGDAATMPFSELAQLDSGETKTGILEVMPEGYGFVRCDNYLPGEADVYVSPAMIRRFGLRTGDILVGNTRIKNQNEKFSALLYVNTVNGFSLEETAARAKFENLTPIFPNERIRLEVPGAGNSNISMRMMDLISPIGKGQRGMIVSQPKTGKTTLLKQVAKSVTHNHPNMHLIVLLIDERPEEVTDIKESIQGENVEVIYSTFDELPENHKRVSEMVIERAKRLVEHGGDVMILLDSITRLARAYNLTVQPSGRTLSGGLDPAALYMPKRFFGAARNMREGGSLTVLATALVDTGSKMDDVVFEEFKGTGNMEMVLDRSLSEKRLFPAIDLPRSSTRRDDLLLDQEELEANFLIRKAFGGSKSEEAVENIISMFRKTKDNKELIQLVKKVKIV